MRRTPTNVRHSGESRNPSQVGVPHVRRAVLSRSTMGSGFRRNDGEWVYLPRNFFGTSYATSALSLASSISRSHLPSGVTSIDDAPFCE